jgi:hypothetical protein
MKAEIGDKVFVSNRVGARPTPFMIGWVRSITGDGQLRIEKGDFFIYREQDEVKIIEKAN